MVCGQYLEFYFDGVFLSCSQVCPVRVQATSPLGRLILVRLRLEVQTRFPNLDWHCSRVEVCRLTKGQGSHSETQVFLCDRWLRPADGDVELRSGKCEWRLMTVRRKQRHVDPSTKISLCPHITLQVCPCKSSPLNLKQFFLLLVHSVFAGGGDRREAEAAEAQTAATSAAAHQVPDVTVLACWFTSYSALIGHILESCRGAARSVCELYSVGGVIQTRQHVYSTLISDLWSMTLNVKMGYYIIFTHMSRTGWNI